MSETYVNSAYTVAEMDEAIGAVAGISNNKFDKSSVAQAFGTATDKVVSQKVVTDSILYPGEETSLTWYRKSVNPSPDGKIYADNYADSTIRLLNVDGNTTQGPDITNKMVTISVDSGYKYACVLYKDVSGVKNITSYSDWKYYTEPTNWFANGEYKYLLIMLAKTDNSEILTTESSAIHIETFDSVKGQAANTVKYIAQSLTTGQQKLARDNIMAMPGKILGKYENKILSFVKSDSFHLISNGITNVELFIGETSKFSKTSVMFLSFSLSFNGFIYLSGITYNDEVFHYNYAFQSGDTYGWIKFTDGYGIVDIFGNTEVTLTNG